LENEPTRDVVLTLSEGFFQGLAGFFGVGFGWLIGLMLLNPTGEMPIQTEHTSENCDDQRSLVAGRAGE
jgi:hypothetical protein